MQFASLIRSLLIITLLMLIVSTTLAQEPDNTQIFYYENEYPSHLDNVLLQQNLCLEGVLRLNPNLEMNNIAYGQRLIFPTDEPCYRNGWFDSEPGQSAPRLKYYENGKWLAEPYYSEFVVYVRRSEANSVENIARQYNICTDRLLADNVLLQNFEAYKVYAWFSFDVFIPKDAQPCDPYWGQSTPPKKGLEIEVPTEIVTPLFFVQEYNLCREALTISWDYLYQQPTTNTVSTITLPNDALPCYNEKGQRLRYVDDLGELLETPQYTNMEVYVAKPGETLLEIARRKAVCAVDMLRVNRFIDLPALVSVEIFIPPMRICPEDIKAYPLLTQLTDLKQISQKLNICLKDIQPLNPHFMPSGDNWILEKTPTGESATVWLILPNGAVYCHWDYVAIEGSTIFDIERELNVCYQEFTDPWTVHYDILIRNDYTTLSIPYKAQPCYNQQRQRLQYPIPYLSQSIDQSSELQYADMPIHIFQRKDTVYSVSREYNVCVRDLLAANPLLSEMMPTGYPTFIPKTRACYDKATGMPLIYEDEHGQPLPQPKVGEQLVYYGGQPINRLSSYYNVCANRIEDANREKLEQRSSYLGWIIPTDRPPCYDQDGNPIDYVCYQQPVDFNVDNSGSALSFDYEGTACYDLAQPETEVWYHGKPYKIIPYYNHTMLDSRAFTAWCYGVSLDEINTINDNADILAILPFQSRAIPKPTRDCYIEKPQLLSGQRHYLVQEGDTLQGIAQRYRTSPRWIANANDLDENRMIWTGQFLIIPSGPAITELYLWLTSLWTSVVVTAGIVYFWLQRRHRSLKPKGSTA